MGRAASAYERELKGLLEADPTDVVRYGRTLPPLERSMFERIRDAPFLVVRAAGSFGFDLVALRTDFAFPLEVKASSSETIRFSSGGGRADEQLARHRAAVDRVGLLVVYAYRRNGTRRGDRWRFFVANGTSTPRGRNALLLGRLPAVDRTREGRGVLRWEHGLPLHQFVHRLAFLAAPATPAS